MADDQDLAGLPVRDLWETIPESVREEFLARRAGRGGDGDPDPLSEGWEPLRPIVLTDRAYRSLEATVAGLMHLAAAACQRRASTLGELRDALQIRGALPLMDPDRRLVASELTRFARPDLLTEGGRLRLLEFNNSTRLGGDSKAPRMADGFSRLCPGAGLRPPRSVVTARSEALVRTLGPGGGDAGPPWRLLVPSFSVLDDTGARLRHDKLKSLVRADAERVGFEVVRADLADLRLDAADRLLVGGEPIDLVLIQWGKGEAARIVDDDGGLAALRRADHAGTVRFFPRTESALLASKTVLAWMHEDCDAGLGSSAERDLVRTHVPATIAVGQFDTSPDEQAACEDAYDLPAAVADEQDRLVLKPANGKSGAGVYFGHQHSPEAWRSLVLEAACRRPMVVQRRVEPDLVTMPFVHRDSGERRTAVTPFVMGSFMVDGAATTVGVRHTGPQADGSDVVISLSRGALSNTVVLTTSGGGTSG